MIGPEREAHPEDEGLLRFLDGEAGGERRALRAHLRRCAGCRDRARELRGTARELGATIAMLDRDPPESLLPRTFREVQDRHGVRPAGRVPAAHPWRRIAAAVLLAVAVGTLATPLPARVMEWITHGWERVASPGSGPAEPARAPDAPAQGGTGAEYRFVPRGAEFRVEFAAAQAEGELRVRATAEGTAALEVLGPGPAREGVLVLPSELRIRNAAEGTARYRLELPASVERVRVEVGGAAPVVLRLGEIPPGTELVVPLGAARE